MLLRKLSISIASVFLFHLSLDAFTIINQTDSEKHLEIQEAFRPVSKTSGKYESPESLGHEPHKVTILPNSLSSFDLFEPCSIVLVSFRTEEIDHKKKEITRTVITTSYGAQKGDLITDDWGLIIHKPLPKPQRTIGFSIDQFRKEHDWEQSVKLGYGIKCLDPKELDKVDSFEELPKELW